MLKPRMAVQTLPSYHPPLAGREGLRFDFNENTVGCSPRVLERLRRLTAEHLARYPERAVAEEQVAKFLGVDPAELLLTNGVDEAIHLLCQTYLDPGDEALIVVPTYSMYRIYVMAAGAELVSIPTNADFRFPTIELISRITPRTRLIAIANPNNPTGTAASPEELLQLVRAAPEAAVLIDEAYFEFYGKTLLGRSREFGNLFVTRTFSKAYGLAGLRVGALTGNEAQMRALRRVSSPYNVNAVAIACLPEAIRDQDYIHKYADEVLRGRVLVQELLEHRGIQFWPSEANFVLMRVAESADGAAAFVEKMRQQGILVRDRSSDYACEGCVRITLGPREHAARALEALTKTFDERGVTQGVTQR